MSCGVGRRHGSDPALLWLWPRPAAIAPIQPLAWEPPYAVGAAREMAKTQQKKENRQETSRARMDYIPITLTILIPICLNSFLFR